MNNTIELNSKTILEQKIENLSQFFNIKEVESIKPNIKSIGKYYRINKIAYTLFHHSNDFIHMGISRSGKYKEEDVYEQANIVAKFIDKIKAKKVLELATGRGANSVYLAKKYKDVEFHGIDLPNGQLSYAISKAKKVKNFFPSEVDYHNLKQFPSNTFDIIFIIEALCHSGNKEQVIQEVKRVLKKDGIFIVIDGFSKKTKLTDIEKTAKRLVERGMMVDSFDYYKEFKIKLNKNNFKIIEEEDASLLILPNLKRFEQQAKVLFKLPEIISNSIIKIFPQEFTRNAISGYLMPDLIENEITGYYIIICKK